MFLGAKKNSLQVFEKHCSVRPKRWQKMKEREKKSLRFKDCATLYLIFPVIVQRVLFSTLCIVIVIWGMFTFQFCPHLQDTH